MKITSLNIPKDKCGQNGLDDILMEHLQQMVLVVGKNGAGKSRLLAKVKTAVETQILPSEKGQILLDIRSQSDAITHFKSEISNFQLADYLRDMSEPERTRQVERTKQNILQHQQSLDSFKQRLSESFVIYDGDLNKRNVIHFLPKNLNLEDPRNLSPLDAESRSRQVTETIAVDSLSYSSLSRVQDLHTQYWNATHQNTNLPPDKKAGIISSYNDLQQIIKELLGTELGNDERNYATLFGFPVGISQLSDGQKVLLQLAVAIHAHNLKLSETILLLDEPENHLHPAAIIDVIEKLKQAIPQGQIWIATHSIAIIAHFFSEASVYYLEAGKASKAGREKTKVLESLLGDEERVRRQAEFLEEPVTHAMNIYSAQCLLPPEVVTTGVSDPQMKQIRDVLFVSRTDEIKVLDFGAGKGRLVTNLVETATEPAQLKEFVNYVAFDCEDENRTECEKQIGRIYESCLNRWFKSYQDLLNHHNKGSFDVIVMTNVLHEISPVEWLKLFGPSGELTELLADNGHLLLVEDQRIPVGEHAHEFGFIVLDTGALKDLCNISGSDKQILQASERDGRLKAHLIPKAYIQRIDNNSVKRALETHCQHAKSEIEQLRKQRDKSKSRIFAFWVHQYANSKLALEAIGLR